MRTEYQAELDRLVDKLDVMAGLVDQALATATTALLRADRPLANSVLAITDQADAAQRDIDHHAVGLIARQQPVATDLRGIIAYLRASADLERMAILAAHIVRITAQRYPAHVVPVELADTVSRMGAVAHQLVEAARRAIRSNQWAAVFDPDTADDEMDALQRQLYEHTLDPAGHHTPTTVFDLALVGRYYERLGDHAVAVAERMAYRAGAIVLDT